MSKIRTQKQFFSFFLQNLLILFYYFNYYFIIFIRSPILDPKIPLMSDMSHKLYTRIPKVIRPTNSTHESQQQHTQWFLMRKERIPKVFPNEKRHIPLALPNNHSLLLCGEMCPNHEWTMGVGITGASHQSKEQNVLNSL